MRLRLARVLIPLASLLLGAAALAQPRQPTDGALYVGTSERGRTLLASLHLFPPDGAELRLLEAPAGHGEEVSVELLLTGPYFEHESELEVSTETWTFIADVLPDGNLDSLGEAELYLYDLDPIVMEAVGTVVLGGLRLADGSFAVQRWTPFFYREPWSEVSFDVSLDEMAQLGLRQRAEHPESIAGTFSESRNTVLTAFDRDLISYYNYIDSYTGGAHPNSFREASTLVAVDGEPWSEVGEVCEAAALLGWECDEQILRSTVIRELLEEEAAWVVEGEVTTETRWLLDSFVLTPTAVSVLFDSYQVGPYVQGPFEVEVPYGELAE